MEQTADGNTRLLTRRRVELVRHSNDLRLGGVLIAPSILRGEVRAFGENCVEEFLRNGKLRVRASAKVRECYSGARRRRPTEYCEGYFEGKH